MSGHDTCSCSERQPLSWLTLELFQLGELGGEKRLRVLAHLERCSCCRSCIQRIEADRERVLPALPAMPRRRAWWRSRRARTALVGAVAAAAVLLLLLALPRTPPPSTHPPRRLAAFKGGELAIGLVRERRGAVEQDPARFAPGDRFKVLVTAPSVDPPLAGQVVVFQSGSVFFPLPLASPLPDGNRRPLAGAFALSGAAPVIVCLAVGDRPADVSRKRLSRGRPSDLPESLDVVCVPLQPVRVR